MRIGKDEEHRQAMADVVSTVVCVRNRIAAEALTDDRLCVHCGTPFDVAGVESERLLFCSASCVWASDELRRETERQLEAAQPFPRRGLFRVAMQKRLEDEALVFAMAGAGANVRQIWRYTALPKRRIERIVASAEHMEPPARVARRVPLAAAAAEARPG